MLNDKLQNHNIILASGSPRRQQFFKDLGLNFEIRLKPVDEDYPNRLRHFEISDYLAHPKIFLLQAIPLFGITTKLWENQEIIKMLSTF